MRPLRIKSKETAYYHVMSRIIERRFFFKNQYKRVFRQMMRRVAEFSNVHILSYCIMDNHFHILIRIPKQAQVSDDVLLARIRCLYSRVEYEKILSEYKISRLSVATHDAFRKKYMRRMNDLSEFMKTLKQRFSIYFNRHNERLGTLWEDRYRSVLVESPASESGHRALLAIGAYIECNAVRAGIAASPLQYAWCSAGESFSVSHGGNQKRAVMVEVAEFVRCIVQDSRMLINDCCSWYHAYLAEKGQGQLEERKIINHDARRFCCGRLYTRSRCFSEGAILGGHAFVESSLKMYGRYLASERVRQPVSINNNDLAIAKNVREKENNVRCAEYHPPAF